MAPMVKLSFWFITPGVGCRFWIWDFEEVIDIVVDCVSRQEWWTPPIRVKGNSCFINIWYLCGFCGMFGLLTAYQKAGNERIANENKQKFPPILTQMATLDMAFLVMPPFLLENSIQKPLIGRSCSEKIGPLFMIIVLLGQSYLKPGTENAALWRCHSMKGKKNKHLVCISFPPQALLHYSIKEVV